MSLAGNTKGDDQANTYMVNGRKKVEVHRLVVQDNMITTSMGGVLPEQVDAALFEHILDIGCGSGGWILEVAQIFPRTQLVGVDINPPMLKHARKQAETLGLAERVMFREMDVLQHLDFPDTSFDLVNLRFGASYVRMWDWPHLIAEMCRVARPGGVLRITEPEPITQSSSPALTQLNLKLIQALHRAGNFLTEESTGVTAHLAELLTNGWCVDVQVKIFRLEFQAGKPETQLLVEDLESGFQAASSFIQKWTGTSKTEYSTLYQQVCKEMEQSDFHATWLLSTAWGKKDTAKRP